MNVRLISILSAALSLPALNPAEACNLNEIQKPSTRIGICRQAVGIATGFGCTSLLMETQVADQFQQIALARRCGFNAEAQKLETYYKQTTPFVVSLYECVDTSVDRADIEAKAKLEVEKSLAKLPAGCSPELKEKMEKRLPKLIAIDAKSLTDVQTLAKQIELVPRLTK